MSKVEGISIMCLTFLGNHCKSFYASNKRIKFIPTHLKIVKGRVVHYGDFLRDDSIRDIVPLSPSKITELSSYNFI